MREQPLTLKVWVADKVSAENCYAGSVALAKLPRLTSMLADSNGQLEVRLALGPDPKAVAQLTGSITGDVTVICQRCLNAIAWPLDVEVDLCVVRNEAEEEKLLAEREPVMLVEGFLMMLDVIEDEAILALPLAPTCKTQDCHTQISSDKLETKGPEIGDNIRPLQNKPNPFASLKGKIGSN